MPLNIPGLLAPFQLIIYPRLVVPHISVKGAKTSRVIVGIAQMGIFQEDIRHLDFRALKKAGYRGAVFDKDNCLTIPYRDALVAELKEAWNECLNTFGEGNVIIVSNSAGTYLDAGGIQAESVSFHLRAPVLVHNSFKPAYSCISAIRAYFSSLPSPVKDHELIVVGDRIFTDVIMANRIRKVSQGNWKPLPSPKSLNEKTETDMTHVNAALNGPLAIWTTGVWKKEAMVMRYLEKRLISAVVRWSTIEAVDASGFVKAIPEPVIKRTPWYAQLLSRS